MAEVGVAERAAKALPEGAAEEEPEARAEPAAQEGSAAGKKAAAQAAEAMAGPAAGAGFHRGVQTRLGKPDPRSSWPHPL